MRVRRDAALHLCTETSVFDARWVAQHLGDVLCARLEAVSEDGAREHARRVANAVSVCVAHGDAAGDLHQALAALVALHVAQQLGLLEALHVLAHVQLEGLRPNGQQSAEIDSARAANQRPSASRLFRALAQLTQGALLPRAPRPRL